MNILLIYAYPNNEGFNHSIKENVMKGIAKTNTVKEIDLYKENFNPVLYFDTKHPRRDLYRDNSTQKYREMVDWSDFLIFIYPIWWSSTPAILKGFVDRVFAKDFAYRYKGIFPVGLLKGKRAWIINTHDTPAFYARFFQKDYGRVFSKQILNMCGISTYKHTSMAYVRGANQKSLEKFLNKIAKISGKL